MTYKRDQQTERWIAKTGFNVSTFNSTSVLVLQAIKALHALIKQYGEKLDERQLKVLDDFLESTRTKRNRELITDGRCYNVLNMHSKIKRQEFKTQRSSKSKGK